MRWVPLLPCLWAVLGYGRDLVYSIACYMAKKGLKVPSILIFCVKRVFSECICDIWWAVVFVG